MAIGWLDLFRALALVLVIEGLLPFVSPRIMRRTMESTVQLDNRTLRITGFVSMLAGILLLYLI
ncbi:MAG TPA: DUF2065 domain-containing protein [Gammaproteobacteria bacterium]|nr:DUF2065 domain-containing protein [Gammaproteobacteria bacterium]